MPASHGSALRQGAVKAIRYPGASWVPVECEGLTLRRASLPTASHNAVHVVRISIWLYGSIDPPALSTLEKSEGTLKAHREWTCRSNNVCVASLVCLLKGESWWAWNQILFFFQACLRKITIVADLPSLCLKIRTTSLLFGLQSAVVRCHSCMLAARNSVFDAQAMEGVGLPGNCCSPNFHGIRCPLVCISS